MDLGERVEDRAGRLAHEMQRAAHVERAVQRVFGASQISHAHANLAERGEGDAQAMRGAGLFLEFHAALGE
jgi:hypothetical protein